MLLSFRNRQQPYDHSSLCLAGKDIKVAICTVNAVIETAGSFICSIVFVKISV